MRLKRLLRTAALTALLSAPAAAQELITPLDDVVKGTQELTVMVPRDSLATRVEATLDGRKVAQGTIDYGRARLTVDFGSIPFPHELSFTAYDARNQVLGESNRQINAGGRNAYVDILAPYARSNAQEGAAALVCAHVARGSAIASASLQSGESVSPLSPARDARCDGIALAGTLPSIETPYVSARITLENGELVEDTVHLDHYVTPFQSEITVRSFQYLVRPLDKDGKPVAGLTQASFHVSEDRNELPVQAVVPITDAPLDLEIMFDNSVSTVGDSSLENALSESVLALVEPQDRVRVSTIGTTPRVVLDHWSSDKEEIAAALHYATNITTSPPSNGTAAYDALEQAIYRFQSTGVRQGSAGAIIYMTDGTDTVTKTDRSRREEQLLRYAAASGIQIYSLSILTPLGISDRGNLQINPVNHTFLDELVSRTGGERTALTLLANPAAFSWKISELEQDILRLPEKYQARMDALMAENLDVSELRERMRKESDLLQLRISLHKTERAHQEVIAAKEPSIANRVREAIAMAGAQLRSQYVVSFQTDTSGRPREHRLQITVDDPRVAKVNAPTGAYY